MGTDVATDRCGHYLNSIRKKPCFVRRPLSLEPSLPPRSHVQPGCFFKENYLCPCPLIICWTTKHTYYKYMLTQFVLRQLFDIFFFLYETRRLSSSSSHRFILWRCLSNCLPTIPIIKKY